MKIIPNHSIAVGGVHCEGGQPVEVADSIGLQLVSEGIAKRAPSPVLAPPRPVVETAEVRPATETATPRKTSRTAPRFLKS